MEKERLNQLPMAILNAFHPDFVFLVTPDKVQHFPARQWQLRDYQAMLQDHLGKDYQLFEWHSAVVAEGHPDLLIVMPKYQKVADFT